MRHLVVLAGPAAFGVAVLAACSSPAAVDPGPREFEITPEQPRIGQHFTVKLSRVISPPRAQASQPEPSLPDGHYLVLLGAVRENPLLAPWPFDWPRPAAGPAADTTTVIGAIDVADGSGAASFRLEVDYGAFKPESGKPLQLQFQGPSRAMGTAFVVGGP